VDFLAQYDEDEKPFTVHDITCTMRDSGQKAGDILRLLQLERRRDERGHENDEQGRENDEQGHENDEQGHENDEQGRENDERERERDNPRIRQASVSSRSSSSARQRAIDLEALRNEPDSGRREEALLQCIADLEERLAAARGRSSSTSGSSVSSGSSRRKRRREIDDLGTIKEEMKPPAQPQTPEMPVRTQDLRGLIDLTLSDDDDENRDELESN
jgi:hypothetical protein